MPAQPTAPFQSIPDLLAERNSLLSEVKKLRKDKARMDFMDKSELSALCWNVDGKINNGWTLGDIGEGSEVSAISLRAAIDAAMEANK